MNVTKTVSGMRSYISDRILLFKFIANSNTGKEYGIGGLRKWRLAKSIINNYKKVESLSLWQQQILLVAEILRIPKNISGDVVECGCFNGSSSINLSLACALTGRKLLVCDSFEGLPEPKEGEQYDIHAESDNYYLWEKGEFSSSLEMVKKNIEKYGDISVCSFVKGFFNESLKTVDAENIVFIFEDADMASSVEDILINLWPKLREGCKFYSHEPWSIHVVSVFYNKQWWRDNFNTTPPGFYGSGGGILGGATYSNIGYTVKFDYEKKKQHGAKTLHLGSKGFTPDQ